MAVNEVAKEVEVVTHSKKETLGRREALRKLVWGSLGLSGTIMSVMSLDMFWPRKISGFGSKITVGPVSDFPVNTVTRVNKGNFYLSHMPEGFIALYWRCPHLGCTVPWIETESRFVCPCHGSIYEPNGNRIAGPAPRPMDYMQIEIVDGQVVVDTSKINKREVWDPSQATPV